MRHSEEVEKDRDIERRKTKSERKRGRDRERQREMSNIMLYYLSPCTCMMCMLGNYICVCDSKNNICTCSKVSTYFNVVAELRS